MYIPYSRLGPCPLLKFPLLLGIFRRRRRCLSYLQSKASKGVIKSDGPWMIRATAVLFGVLYLSLGNGRLAMEQTIFPFLRNAAQIRFCGCRKPPADRHRQTDCRPAEAADADGVKEAIAAPPAPSAVLLRTSRTPGGTILFPKVLLGKVNR